MLTNSRLRQLVDRLDAIDHIERIRIHTRLPIVLPSRIEDDLMEQKIMEVIQEHTKVKEVDVKTADLRAQEKMEVNTHE